MAKYVSALATIKAIIDRTIEEDTGNGVDNEEMSEDEERIIKTLDKVVVELDMINSSKPLTSFRSSLTTTF